jgi:nicotinate-nucleotide pyrophosphorylase (carboxylating)
MMEDIRDAIFSSLKDREFTALLRAEDSGCISGLEDADIQAKALGVSFVRLKKEGEGVQKNEVIGIIKGRAKQIALAEERIIGALAKFSGVASAARQAVDLAGDRLRIVSGSWKKMPALLKEGIRRAVSAGGASLRITDTPMIYLDKNYIRMFGSIPETMEALRDFTQLKVLQIRGERRPIEEETRLGVEYGAGILMVDTGNRQDLVRCFQTLEKMGVRDRVQVAYAGGILLKDIPQYRDMGVDMLCIGREIIDAPLLDMSLDVEPVSPPPPPPQGWSVYGPEPAGKNRTMDQQHYPGKSKPDRTGGEDGGGIGAPRG